MVSYAGLVEGRRIAVNGLWERITRIAVNGLGERITRIGQREGRGDVQSKVQVGVI